MQEQPQLFDIPAITLQRIVNYLGDMPYKDVAPIMSLIENTVKVKDNGASERPIRQRQRRRPKS
jgi:hypothetical protein